MSGNPTDAALYPDPPYEFRGAELVVATLLDGSVPERVIPAALEPEPVAVAVVVFANYPDSTIGPHREALVLLPVTLDGRPAIHCPRAYVTDDVALCAGREIWGFPRKLAEIDFRVRGGEVRARVTRRGRELLRLDGEVAQLADPADFDGSGEQPFVTYKVIPGVAGEQPDVSLLAVVRPDSRATRAWTGSGELRASGEVAAVVGGGGAVRLLRTEADLLLPRGEMVAPVVPTST